MFTEHVGNLQAAKTLDELKQVLEQVLGDCEAALTHDGTLRIEGALPAGAKDDAVLYVKNGYIAPNDADTEMDANGNLPNGWGHIVDGAAWFMGQVRFDKAPAGDGAGGFAALPAGAVILWAGAIGSIPSGWALMDGVANSVGNGGSGINLTGIPYPYISGDPTFGTLGASVSLGFAATISGNGGTTGLTISAHSGSGTITTSESGAHSHTISEAEFDSKVTINTPSLAHTEASAGTIITNVDIWSVDDSPILAAFDGTTAPDSNFTSSVGEITSAGHNHTIANESIADALADHAAAACTTTFSSALATDSTLDHDHTITGTQVATVLASHTGTVSNNSIASGLSIGTPSTLRPAGTVLAFIEKLAA